WKPAGGPGSDSPAGGAGVGEGGASVDSPGGEVGSVPESEPSPAVPPPPPSVTVEPSSCVDPSPSEGCVVSRSPGGVVVEFGAAAAKPATAFVAMLVAPAESTPPAVLPPAPLAAAPNPPAAPEPLPAPPLLAAAPTPSFDTNSLSAAIAPIGYTAASARLARRS